MGYIRVLGIMENKMETTILYREYGNMILLTLVERFLYYSKLSRTAGRTALEVWRLLNLRVT